MVRITCLQLAPRIADLEHNRVTTSEAIREAADAGAEIIVLPELATSGYVFRSVDEARAVGITPDHELFDDWADAAGSALVIGGFCEVARDGRLYNSAIVMDAGTVVAVYRKTHLWDRELLFFTPGRQPPPVLETVHGRIGVCVCYDLEFPEVTRGLALRGAELVAVPTNWPLVDRPYDEHPPEVVIAMAAARVNRMFIACCDRNGEERGQQWTAGTAIIDESGWVVASAAGGSTATADIDLRRARHKAISERNDTLNDRRPELYGWLSEDSP